MTMWPVLQSMKGWKKNRALHWQHEKNLIPCTIIKQWRNQAETNWPRKWRKIQAQADNNVWELVKWTGVPSNMKEWPGQGLDFWNMLEVASLSTKTKSKIDTIKMLGQKAGLFFVGVHPGKCGMQNEFELSASRQKSNFVEYFDAPICVKWDPNEAE